MNLDCSFSRGGCIRRLLFVLPEVMLHGRFATMIFASTLKVEGDVTRDDAHRRFLAQLSVSFNVCYKGRFLAQRGQRIAHCSRSLCLTATNKKRCLQTDLLRGCLLLLLRIRSAHLGIFKFLKEFAH